MMTRWRWLGVLLCACCVRAADARWPDGVLNYCGFEGYWDEAGWRDQGWAQGGTPGVRFDRETKRFGKGCAQDRRRPGETRGALQLDGNAPQPGKRYVLRVWVKTRDIQGEAAVALQPHEEGKPLRVRRPGREVAASRDARLEPRGSPGAALVGKSRTHLSVPLGQGVGHGLVRRLCFDRGGGRSAAGRPEAAHRGRLRGRSFRRCGAAAKPPEKRRLRRGPQRLVRRKRQAPDRRRHVGGRPAKPALRRVPRVQLLCRSDSPSNRSPPSLPAFLETQDRAARRALAASNCCR